MSRIFVDQPLKEHSSIALFNDAHHYIKNVLRMRPGDPLFLFNGTEKEYSAKIAQIQKDRIIIQISESKITNKESPLDLLIAQAIPKGGKMDDLIPKITELGASHLVPLVTDRSDLKKISEQKLARWRKIAVQSAQQTGRTVVPKISPPVSFSDFLKGFKNGEKILFYELEASHGFKAVLEKSPSSRFCLIIGPEGGFSPQEIALAQKEGCHVVSLGKRILRTETVAPAATAIIQFVKGDLGSCPLADCKTADVFI